MQNRTRNLVVAVFSLIAASAASVQAQTPTITSITGYSDGVGVSSGRWNGQPTRAPATASNRFQNFLVSDSFNYGSPSANPYYWDINGSNFGRSQGTGSIVVGPLPSPFSVTIVSWSATSIRVKAVAPRSFQSCSISLKVTTANGKTSAQFNDNVVGIIKSRGCGQCTWFVAKTRLDNGLSIPTTAYATTGTIPAVGTLDNGYRPTLWDCMNFNGNHVGIITTAPTTTPNADGSVSYTFTVSEYNARWDEAPSSSPRTYKLSKANAAGQKTVLAGIGTSASASWVATGYWR